MLSAVRHCVAQKLPFVAVVDILNSRKAIWLAHVRDHAKDPEEEKDRHPPQYVFHQVECLFDGPDQRDPSSRIDQIATSLEEWTTLDYATMIKNIMRTRHHVNDEINLAPESGFVLALHKAIIQAARRIKPSTDVYAFSSDKQRSINRVSNVVS